MNYSVKIIVDPIVVNCLVQSDSHWVWP